MLAYEGKMWPDTKQILSTFINVEHLINDKVDDDDFLPLFEMDEKIEVEKINKIEKTEQKEWSITSWYTTYCYDTSRKLSWKQSQSS